MMCFILFTIAAFLLTITLLFHRKINRWIFGISAVFCIVYPFLGLLGEKWCRFKVILIGVAIVFVSVFILVLGVGIAVIVINSNDNHFSFESYISIIIPSILAYIFYLIGMCIFHANIIQFGTDQIQFAPSEELSSFVHWLFWVQALANVFVGILTYYIIVAVQFDDVNVSISICAITAIVCLSYVCFILIKRYLIIEPAQHNNPVKLIWRVMRYAWKHKQPVRRSAFTYGEPPPSRLDLGKERYGGPFTTLQVEDVKSFLHIIPVIFASFFFSYQDSKIILQHLKLSSNSTFIEEAIMYIPNIIPCSVVVLLIVFHQFLVVPFQFCFFLSILKRIWLGLVILLLELVALTTFQYFIDNSTNSVSDCIAFGNQTLHICISPYYIFIISQIFQGISMMLVFIGSLEFILAQAPRNMQGLLIGLWLMQYYGIWNFDAVILAIIDDSSIYTAVKTGIVFISVTIYTIAAYKYKYRQRNELSDVNERVIITEYTERQLDQMELLNEDDNSGQTSFYIISEDVF